MSTPFYDLASLVVVPSGYKASKVYAQKPLTTDGQLTFSRASTATRVNSAGLIETVSSNVPRLDYQGSTCPKLLLEPQRTNAQTYSEDFSQGKYTKTDCTISTNVAATLDPAGTNVADKLVEAVTTGGQHYIYFSAQTGANQETQISIFAKAAGRTQFLIWESAITNAQARFNLSNGTISDSSSGNAANLVTTTPTITSYGNGWYRCTLNFKTASGSGTIRVQLYNGSTSYNGNGTDGIYIYGLQEEVNTAYATSYIPTTTAAVTRLADACYKVGIGSLLSASEYTIFWEGTHIPTGQYNSFVTLSQTVNSNNSARFYRNNTNNEIRVALFNSANGLSLDLGSGVTTQTAKCAVRVKAGSYALYVNGALVNSNTSALAPASNLDEVNLQYFNASQSFDQKTGQVLVFKTGLTNAQLAELTAL